MSNPLQSINNMNKTGLCPHGTIPGACPICSGMGGGGGRVGERPQKAGEMSYHECAMIGAMMRAREAQQKMHEQTLLHRAEALKNFEQSLINIAERLADFAVKIQNLSHLPSALHLPLKPIAVIINNIIIPIINKLTNFISNIEEKFAQIREKFIDIQDKLNAIFGEAKAFLDKKISELVSTVKSKFKNLFKIFKRNNTNDDETKIDEDKKIFRLKSFIQKILGKHKNDSENKSGS